MPVRKLAMDRPKWHQPRGRRFVNRRYVPLTRISCWLMGRNCTLHASININGVGTRHFLLDTACFH